MFNRVKQLIVALTAQITPEDRAFVSYYLNKGEQKLLWAMNLPDQRHVLNVAYTALQMAENRQDVNAKLLVKCALLHDVGKVKGDISTVDKIITVIGHNLAPNWSKQWGKLGKGSKRTNLRHAFYVYFNHAERSAVMLTAIGETREVVEIVARHHKTPTDNDLSELVLLRKSDNMH